MAGDISLHGSPEPACLPGLQHWLTTVPSGCSWASPRPMSQEIQALSPPQGPVAPWFLWLRWAKARGFLMMLLGKDLLLQDVPRCPRSSGSPELPPGAIRCCLLCRYSFYLLCCWQQWLPEAFILI